MQEDSIDLSGEWISSFIQNNKIYNEIYTSQVKGGKDNE